VRDRIDRLSTRARSPRFSLLANGRATARRRRGRERDGEGRCRPVCGGDDPTVKAGSWGPKTVEKIIRIGRSRPRQQHLVAMISQPRRLGGCVASPPGAMFPGGAGAGPSSHQVKLFGRPSARCASCSGLAPPVARTSPSFCDVRDHLDASLDVPRLAAMPEMVIARRYARGDGRLARCTRASRRGHFR